MIALPHSLALLVPRATAALDPWSARGKPQGGAGVKRRGV